MSDRPVERGWVRLSALLYRALLRIRYPEELWNRYGEQMVGLFIDDLSERATRRGMAGAAQGWTRALRDLVRPTPGPIHAAGPGGGRGAGRGAESGGQGPNGPGRRLARGLREDIGFAWRTLRRERPFVLTVATVLGAAVALNTAVFAVANAYRVRPLPYPEPGRLVSLSSPVAILPDDVEGVLEMSVTWDLDAFTMVEGSRSYLARGAWVTTDFLDLYGVEPALGRAFTADEGVPGAASVAIIGHGLWQERYGGSPDVLGRTFRAFTSDRPDDAETFTIVGVLPAGFWHFNDYTEVLAPLRGDNVYRLPEADVHGRQRFGSRPLSYSSAWLALYHPLAYTDTATTGSSLPTRASGPPWSRWDGP